MAMDATRLAGMLCLLAMLGLAGVLLACEGSGGLQGPGGGRMGQGPGGRSAGGAGPGGPGAERPGAGKGSASGSGDGQLPGSVCDGVPGTGNLEPDDGSGAAALARVAVEVEHGGIAEPKPERWCAGGSVLNRGNLHVRVEPRQPLHLWLAAVDPRGRARLQAPEGQAAPILDTPERHTFRIEGGQHEAMLLLVVSREPLAEAAPDLASELRAGRAPQRGRALVELSSGAIRAIADEAGVATVPLPYEHVFVGATPGGGGAAGAVLVRR